MNNDKRHLTSGGRSSFKKQIFMENNNTLRVGDVVRLKLKPEVTGVINDFHKSYGHCGNQIDVNSTEAKFSEAIILILGNDLKTEYKRFPVLMLEKV
jgi:hypothetical protein